ncbi:cupin [Photobacterium jeanii]|uniref:Cupin n=1 Tax=Photobacterium jeanii TaxID=858640 RepID=A0A178K2V5_9GAMM|nr:cupin domain-containing protein [Photobacterium jeanii]OAN11649.1 cupin [Photobacterium jeanii]PST91171.1 cupin domain-containing protein [Photobacterium jeanii]
MKANLLTNIPMSMPEEVFTDLVKTEHVRIERIISKGHVTPEGDWYDQDEHEWVMVVKGHAKLVFEEGLKEISLKEGDHINIPAHQRHRVSWTDPTQETIWLAVFYC